MRSEGLRAAKACPQVHHWQFHALTTSETGIPAGAAGILSSVNRQSDWIAALSASASTASAVHAVIDQIIDDSRFGEGRGIAKIAEIILGDLAQDAAHDLA